MPPPPSLRSTSAAVPALARWAPWAWAVGIVVLLSLPQRLVPQPGAGWGWPWLDAWDEALVHAGLFAGQVFWMSWRRSAVRWLHVAGICWLFAVATEIYQGFLGYRSAELRDVAADLTGALLAVLLLRAARARRRIPAGRGR